MVSSRVAGCLVCQNNGNKQTKADKQRSVSLFLSCKFKKKIYYMISVGLNSFFSAEVSMPVHFCIFIVILNTWMIIKDL